MDFISWSVFGTLFILAEFSTGTLYLLAIGLAFLYPVIADIAHAPMGVQVALLSLGIIIHSLVVMVVRKRRSSSPAANIPTDVGQRVEVIAWDAEGGARVIYKGKEWQADKSESEMPDATHGIIQSVQYGRLIISTEQT